MLKIKIISLISIVTLLPLLQGCAAVVAGTAATSVMVAQDRRTAGTIVEDKSIQLKAMQAIQDVAKGDHDVHVNAYSYNNRVLLVGQVPSNQIRAEMAQAVKNIKKVRQVNNEITLDSPTTLKTRSTDSWITTRIKGEMTVTKEVNPARVKIVTENGVVYLMGIMTPREEEITVDIARHTKGVKKVVKIFEYEKL